MISPSKRYWLGIDPGAKGFACVRDDAGNMDWCPLAETAAMMQLLRQLSGHVVMCMVEDVHAMPHQGVTSSFNFGKGLGKVLGWLEALDIPYTQVTPNRWQKTMWLRGDRVAGSPKKTSLNAATRLHPGVDWRRSEDCKVPDDNKADATLICDYCKFTHQQ